VIDDDPASGHNRDTIIKANITVWIFSFVLNLAMFFIRKIFTTSGLSLNPDYVFILRGKIKTTSI
jgi:hypothetical protein